MMAKRATGADRRAMLGKVHMAKKDLALDDDSYRDLLARITNGRRSAADCSDAQLHAVLAEFERLGWKPKFRGNRRRSNARAGAQVSESMRPLVGKIRALWGALDNLGALESGAEAALVAFVKRQTKVDAIAFLDVEGANLVIEALKAWCGREGFEVPTGRNSALAGKRALVRAQWARLARLGVLWVENEYALDEYLSKYVSPHKTGVDQLHAGQLDRGADRLGRWIKYAKKEAEKDK